MRLPRVVWTTTRIRPSASMPSVTYRAAPSDGILDGYREGITKCLFGVREADLVLGQVSLGFDRIELDVHGTSMHIICILSRPTQCGERAKAANVRIKPRREAASA